MKALNIVKIGGNVIDDPIALKHFLSDFSKIDGPKILVHGGGKLATELAKKMNIPVQMVEGKRITDEATLKIATMVYAGYINKNITAQLQSLNCNAIGLSGADGNSITSTKRKVSTVDYGFVGDLNEESVNIAFFNSLLQNNITPVVCAITHNGNGQLLNTNADTIASAISIALSPIYNVQLVYCFEKNGVLSDISNENSVIRTITHVDYQLNKSNGIISEGMIPKLDNAFAAIEKGVKYVQIGKSDSLLRLISINDHEGTRISK